MLINVMCKCLKWSAVGYSSFTQIGTLTGLMLDVFSRCALTTSDCARFDVASWQR